MPLRRAAAVLLGLCLSHAAIAQTTAARAPQAADASSWTLALDNDWLALSHRDADYSGGFMFALSGPAATQFLLSLDPILGFIDGLWMPGSAPTSKSALQFGAQAYTPKDKKSHDVVLDDRPYAGLFSLTSTRMTVAGDADPVWSSAFTIGVLGTGLGKNLHRGFHRLIGNDLPNGYDHQISEGGEPTLKYTVRRQALALDSSDALLGQRADLKWGVEGSLGYITEAALLVSGRFGKFSTPWWSMYPERSEYYAPPGSKYEGDLYLMYGVGARLRGYNSLIQGQFRHSDHTLGGSKLEVGIGEAYAGVVWGITNSTSLSYLVRYQSSEIKSGKGSRDTYNGSLYLNVGY
jgi:hypothetical protein